MSKLKRCPFCGGEAIRKLYSGAFYSVKCTKCWTETNTYFGVNDAVDAWNTRANEVESDD